MLVFVQLKVEMQRESLKTLFQIISSAKESTAKIIIDCLCENHAIPSKCRYPFLLIDKMKSFTLKQKRFYCCILSFSNNKYNIQASNFDQCILSPNRYFLFLFLIPKPKNEIT